MQGCAPGMEFRETLDCRSVQIRRVLVVRSALGEIYEPAWVRGLLDLGIDAQLFDTHRLIPNGLIGRVQQRLLRGPAIVGVNRELLHVVREMRPDVVLLYQGHHFWRDTIQRLRELTFVVGYHNDDMFRKDGEHFLRYQHLMPALKEYEGYHCYRPCNVAELLAAGVPRASVLHSYYIPWLDYPRQLTRPERTRFACDLVFAGHYESDFRSDCLRKAAESGLRVNVFGRRRFWKKAGIHADLRGLCLAEPVLGDEYRVALCGAKISTCFLSKKNRDQYTRRVFEIPACGAFLLAERTSVMRELYEEGKEAEFFASQEEFVSKAVFYSRNDGARNKVARAGQKRAGESGYDIHSRMQQWISDVQKWRLQAARERAAA